MNAQQLINEGRSLQRPCVLLRTYGSGPVAAIWYDRQLNSREGRRCWLTVDCRFIPRFSAPSGYLSVWTGTEDGETRVEVTPGWPQRPGTRLFAEAASILPPIEAVFALGSRTVEEWLTANGWDPCERYNDNFADHDTVDPYLSVWSEEYPLFREDDVYAMLGGWHCPWADHDWYELIDDTLLIYTLRDSEPWLEVWQGADHKFKIIRRIT